MVKDLTIWSLGWVPDVGALDVKHLALLYDMARVYIVHRIWVFGRPSVKVPTRR